MPADTAPALQLGSSLPSSRTLTLDEAAAFLHMHPEEVRSRAKRGLIPGQVSTSAWYRALKRAGLKDFRFHDLRHTWASWHIQIGTPLFALQELEGWKTERMLRRYAHLDADHLRRTWAMRKSMAHSWHTSRRCRNCSMRKCWKLSSLVVARGGIEPPTRGFSIRCSTN